MNYVIAGNENYFRFTYHETPPLTKFYSVAGVSADGKKAKKTKTKKATYSSFVELVLPPCVIEYQIDEGEFNYNTINLDEPWTEYNIGALIIKREFPNSIYIEVYMSEEIKPNQLSYKFNGKLTVLKQPTSFIAHHNLLGFDFVKTYLEFDDGTTNCMEFTNNAPKLTYLISVEKITTTTFVVGEPSEIPFVQSSFYIIFKNEHDQEIKIKKFLIYIRK